MGLEMRDKRARLKELAKRYQRGRKKKEGSDFGGVCQSYQVQSHLRQLVAAQLLTEGGFVGESRATPVNNFVSEHRT